MALKKEWIDPITGVIGEHWDMVSIHYNKQDQMSDLTYGLWVNKAAYDDGKKPMKTISYSITSGSAPTLVAGAEQFVNSYVAAQPEFEGAEVV